MRILSFIGLGLLGCSVAAPDDASSGASNVAAGEAWATLADRDLAAMRQEILAEHPGSVDTANPDFGIWLEEGYREALGYARRSHTLSGYAATLRRYAAGFRDAHLSIVFDVPLDAQRWPGFVVGVTAGEYVVRLSEADQVPIGARLVSCDGRSPAEMLRDDVHPYLGDPALESSTQRFSPWILADTGNPFVKVAEKCNFEVGTEARTVTLEWRAIDEAALKAKLNEAAFGPPRVQGVRTLADGTIWVDLPTFYPTDEASSAELMAIVNSAPSWRNAPRIVFDVRGNGGGSSGWGFGLAAGLWGYDFMVRGFYRLFEDRPQMFADWRASPGVQSTVESYVPVVEPSDPATAELLRSIATGIAQARAEGKPFFSQHDPPPPPDAGEPIEPASSARVFLLTDGRCASACLDFADNLLLIAPGVEHVGLPTHADTQYLQARHAPALPSAKAHLYLPMKVWRNRPRGNGPYIPRHRYPGDLTDTAAVEAWIAGL